MVIYTGVVPKKITKEDSQLLCQAQRVRSLNIEVKEVRSHLPYIVYLMERFLLPFLRDRVIRYCYQTFHDKCCCFSSLMPVKWDVISCPGELTQ